MKIRVEVVYALPDRQWTAVLELPAAATVSDALAASGIDYAVAEDGGRARVGIWGRPVSLDRPLRDRDRVEIYRELQADPKTARRRRALRQERK